MDLPIIVATFGSVVGTISGSYALFRSFQKGRLSESAARQVALTRQAEQVMENMRTNHNEQVEYYRGRIRTLEEELELSKQKEKGANDE